MKKINKPNKPDFWHDLSSLENYQKIKLIHNKKRKTYNIPDLWNWDKYASQIKPFLLNLTNFECCYCGKFINIQNFDIEHFLPKSEFPYLAYCYDNLLPSCQVCNQKLKMNFYPESLGKIRLTEYDEFLKNYKIIKYSQNFFNETKDRIINPYFDNPDDHLIFYPETCEIGFKNNEIAKNTYKVFFIQDKIYHMNLPELSEQIRLMVEENNSKETIFNLANSVGYSYFIEKLYNYWYEIYN